VRFWDGISPFCAISNHAPQNKQHVRPPQLTTRQACAAKTTLQTNRCKESFASICLHYDNHRFR